nr:alpha/beta hydrolase-fold protein [uncultured Roseateles sp.]
MPHTASTARLPRAVRVSTLSTPERASPQLVRFVAGLLLLIAAMLVAPHAFAATQVVFDIDMREEIAAGRFDPAKDIVGVRGGAAPLNWGRSLVAPAAGLGREGWYSATAVFERIPAGGNVPYKFHVEHPGKNDPEGDWETGSNRSLELVSDEVRVSRAFNAPGAPISLSRAGTIERLAPLPGNFVAQRPVQVWLPPNYERDTERRYPVLYLHDGQNVFDAAAAGAEWQVDETAQRLVVDGQIQPLIIVAVHNTSRRIDEYTATARTFEGQTRGGLAPAYARYLIEQLKPSIDARYRTLPDAAHTAVGGSSLGGIMSLWLAVHHGDVFGSALVVSPSLWWDDEFPIRDTQKTPLPMSQPRPKLWLDMGTNEGPDSIRQLRKLRSVLSARGWAAADIGYLEAEGAGHDEGSWAARVEPMLRFVDKQFNARTSSGNSTQQDPFPTNVRSSMPPGPGTYTK